MIGARVQVGAALGVAAVALVAGLVMGRAPDPGDAVERVARAQQNQRSRVQEESRVAALVVDDPDAIDHRLEIAIPVEGDVVVSGQAIGDADLDSLLRAAFVRDPDTQVVLAADTDAPHRRIVAIMERARAAGLTRVSIATGGADPWP